MSTVLNEQFGRTGFILGGSPAAPVGGTWSTLLTANYGGSDFALNGATLAMTGSSGEEIFSFKNSAVLGTIEATVTVPFTPSTDGWVAGAVLHADADSYPCWIAFASASSRWISRFDSASDSIVTNVLATLSDSSIAAGNRAAHTLTFSSAANGNLSMTIDGVAVAFGTVNDAAMTTAGRPGIAARGATLDNVLAVDAVAGDTTPPDITSTGTGSTNGPFAANAAENSTAAFITLTSNESVAWGALGGADASRFVKLNETATTVQLGFSPALNFEALPHANPFVVTVTATDAASNARTVTVNASITNVTELPGAPTIGTATAGNASASVTFTAPAAGSAPTVTGYTVTSSPGGLTGTGSASPITVSGLTNGTAYTFTVTATNSDGTGPASAASNSVTPSAGGGGGDTTPPTMSAASVTGGTLSATGSITSNEAGTLWVKMDGSATAADPGAGSEAGAGWASQSMTASANAVNFGAQPAGTRYGHFIGVDAAGNRAAVVNASGTVSAGVGTYTAQTDIVAVSGIALANTLVYFTWCPSGRPGSITSAVNGSTTTDSTGRATISHSVAGDGFVIIGTRPGPVVSNDRVFAQFLSLA